MGWVDRRRRMRPLQLAFASEGGGGEVGWVVVGKAGVVELGGSSSANVTHLAFASEGGVLGDETAQKGGGRG
jgi:hypothetical protein